MGNIRKAVLVVVAVVAGLIATVNETYSSATGCLAGRVSTSTARASG
jgi:hypothetical protein